VATSSIAPSMPTDAEERGVDDILQAAHDSVEGLVWRVNGVAGLPGGMRPEDVPPFRSRSRTSRP
jgi:hypothetical protein